MRDMPPLARLILRAMRFGALLCAGFLTLFLAIALWQTVLAGRDLAYRDYGFLAVLAVLLIGCLWLARAVGQELSK